MKKTQRQTEQTEPDVTPRREGGDDSIAESSPLDSRADEKVTVNEQRDDSLSQNPLYKGGNRNTSIEQDDV